MLARVSASVAFISAVVCRNASIAFTYSHIRPNSFMHLQDAIRHATEQPVEAPTVHHADCFSSFILFSSMLRKLLG